MELRYPPGRKRGPHPARSFEQLYNAERASFSQWDEEGNKVDALELGVAMLEGYVEEYGTDDHIEIIAPEMAFHVHIFAKNGTYLATWVGRTDAAFIDLSKSTRNRKSIGLFEHKTGKTIEEFVRIVSQYGDQAVAYWWVGSQVFHDKGVIPPSEQIDHVLFNWLKKSLPSSKVRNAEGHTLNKPTKDRLVEECERLHLAIPKKATVATLTDLLAGAGVDVPQLGEVSKVQPRPLFHRQALDLGDASLEQIGWRISAEAWERQQMREGKLPVYKNPSRDCGMCQFQDVCELHEIGQDWQSVLDLEFIHWNPYEGADEFDR